VTTAEPNGQETFEVFVFDLVAGRFLACFTATIAPRLHCAISF
jgi:hypothetical protein